MKLTALAILAVISTVLLAAPSHGEKDPASADGVNPILNQFWKTLDEKSLYAAIMSLPVRGSTTENMESFADQATGAFSRAGKCYGREEVSREAIGTRLVKVKYLLRFDENPMFLDMVFYRADMGWKFLTFHYNSKDPASVIAELSASHECVQTQSSATGDVDPILTKFWSVWDSTSPGDAILSQRPDAKETMQSVAEGTNGWVSRAGKCYGREEISRVAIVSRVIRLRYVLRYESGPLFVDLFYYRPDDRWVPLRVNVDTDAEKHISETAAAKPSERDGAQKLAHTGD